MKEWRNGIESVMQVLNRIIFLANFLAVFNFGILLLGTSTGRNVSKVFFRESAVHLVTLSGTIYNHESKQAQSSAGFNAACWHLANVIHLSRIFVGLSLLNMHQVHPPRFMFVVAAITVISTLRYIILNLDTRSKKNEER